MSSSRYYNNNDYNAYNYDAPYRSKQPYNNYYTNATQSRQQYSYQPAGTTKSPKSKQRSKVIQDSGRIPGPYSPTLGRKKPVGKWKAKRKEEEEKRMAKGEFDPTEIEEELNKFKKGTFIFDEELATRTQTVSRDKKGTKSNTGRRSGSSSMNGAHKKDKKDDKYAQFGLQKTKKPPPQIFDEVDELPRPVPPNYDERMKDKSSKGTKSENNEENKTTDDDAKDSKKNSKKESSSSDKKKQKKESSADIKKRSSKKSSRTKSRRKKERTRIQQIVTVSPNRPPYGAFAVPPIGTENYYPTGYGYGYAPAPLPYGYEYGIPPPMPQPQPDPYSTGYGYTTPYAAPTTAVDPYYTTNPYGQYPQTTATGYDPSYMYNTYGAYNTNAATLTNALQQNDPYSTPKRKSKRNKDSANIDLTTPLNDDKSNGNIKPEKMSPGRRVNKIQKQLEYYFSFENMSNDQFLRKKMNEEGWIKIDLLMQFKRMKQLGATKELIVEASYHSQIIEIEPKQESKIRMTKYWKQYISRSSSSKKDKDKKKSSSSSKRKSSSAKAREREKEREKEKEKQLDAAEVNTQTIESIVAGIENKMERKRKRREAREKRKKEKEAKEKKDKEKEKKEEKDKEEQDKDANKENEANKENKENNEENKENNEENNDKKKDKKEEAGDVSQQNENEEDSQELIRKDQEQNDQDKGDPDGSDMEVID